MDHEPCDEPIPQTDVSVMEPGVLTDERATHGVATPKEIGGSPSATATSSIGVSSAVDTESTVSHHEEPPHKKQKVEDDEATAKSLLALSTPFAEPLKEVPAIDMSPPTTPVVIVPLATQDPTPQAPASTLLPTPIVSSVESAPVLPSSLHDDVIMCEESSATPIARPSASPSPPRIVSPAEDVDMVNGANTEASHMNEVAPSTVHSTLTAIQAVVSVSPTLEASPEKSTAASAATLAPNAALGESPIRQHSAASMASEFVDDAASEVGKPALGKAEPRASPSEALVRHTASILVDAPPSAEVMNGGSDMEVTPPATVTCAASTPPAAHLSATPPPVEDTEILGVARRAGAPSAPPSALHDLAVEANAPSSPSSGMSIVGPASCLPEQLLEPSTPSTETKLPAALSRKEEPLLSSVCTEPGQPQKATGASSVVAGVSPQVAAPLAGVATAGDVDAIGLDKPTDTGPRIHPTDSNDGHDMPEKSADAQPPLTPPTFAPRTDTPPLPSMDTLHVPTKQPLESTAVSVHSRSPHAPAKFADLVLRSPLDAAADLVVMSQTSSTDPAKPPQDDDTPEWQQRIKKELAADPATPSRPPRGSNPVWILDSSDASSVGAQAMSQPAEKDRKKSRLKRKRQSDKSAAEGAVASPGDGSGAKTVRRRPDAHGDGQPGPHAALPPSPRSNADAVTPDTTSSNRKGKDARGASGALGGKRSLEKAKQDRRKSVGPTSTASPASTAVDLTMPRVAPEIQPNGLAGRLARASQAEARGRSRGSSDDDDAEVPTRPQRKKAKGKQAARPSPPVEIVIESDDDDDDDDDFIVSPALNLSTDPSAASLLTTSSSSDNEAIVVMVLPSTKPSASSPWRATRSSTEKGRTAKRRRGRPRKLVETATVDLSNDGPTTVVLVDDSDESEGDPQGNDCSLNGPPPSPDLPLASLEDLLPPQAAALPAGVHETASALAREDDRSQGLDVGVDVESVVADLPLPSMAHESTAPTLNGNDDNATNVVTSVLDGLADEDDDISSTLSIALGEVAPPPSVADTLADDPNTLAMPVPFPADEEMMVASQQDAPSSVDLVDAEVPLEPHRVGDTTLPHDPLSNEAVVDLALPSATVETPVAPVVPEQERTVLGEEVQQPLDGLEATRVAIDSTADIPVTVDGIQSGALVPSGIGRATPAVATAAPLSEGLVGPGLASDVHVTTAAVESQVEAETVLPDGGQLVAAAVRIGVDLATDVDEPAPIQVSLDQGTTGIQGAPRQSDEIARTNGRAVDESAVDASPSLQDEAVASADKNTSTAPPLPTSNDSSPPPDQTVHQPDVVPRQLDGQESCTEVPSAALDESRSTAGDSPSPISELAVPTVAGDLSPSSMEAEPAAPVHGSDKASSSEPEAAAGDQPLPLPVESSAEVDGPAIPRPASPSIASTSAADQSTVLQEATCQSNLVDATTPQPLSDAPATSPTLDSTDVQSAVPSGLTEPIVKVEPGGSVALGESDGAQAPRRRRRKRPPPPAVASGGAAIDLTSADTTDTSTTKGPGDDGMSSSDGYLSENDVGDSDSDEDGAPPADMDTSNEDDVAPPSSSPAAPFFPGPRKEVASYVAAYTEPETAAPPTTPPPSEDETRAEDAAADRPPRNDVEAIEDVPPPSQFHRPQFPCKESLIAEAFAESENDKAAERDASDSDDDRAPPPPPPGPPSPPPRRAVVDLTDTPPPASPLRLQAKQLPPHIYNAKKTPLGSPSSSSSSDSSSSDSEEDDRPPSPPHDHPFRYAKQVADLLVSENEAENDDDDEDDDEVAFGDGADHHSDDQIESDSSDVVLVGVIPAPSLAAEPVVPAGESLHPVLRGTYQVAAHEATWTGTWGFSETSPAAPTKFSYKCVAPHWSAHDTRVPMNGVYNGYFIVLGEGHGRPQRVLERGVELEFTELAAGSYVVDGTGCNKFGPFSLRGYYQWGNPLTLVKMYTPTAA